MFAAASFPYSKHERMTPERHARVEIVCLCTGEPWECSGGYVTPGRRRGLGERGRSRGLRGSGLGGLWSGRALGGKHVQAARPCLCEEEKIMWLFIISSWLGCIELTIAKLAAGC